jgi:asparagine synthase (glutamine-hydrolysing)
MCGILSILSSPKDDKYLEINDNINDAFQLGQHRGPEFSTLGKIKDNLIFGFHRLAINGLNIESNQPIIIGGVYLICNGEIYNYKLLYDMINASANASASASINASASISPIAPQTNSDCEVIIHLYLRYGFEHMLKMLDGVFAIILYDYNIDKMYVARDYYGIRPLYYVQNYNYLNDGTIFHMIAFASEIKVLNEFSSNVQPEFFDNESKIHHFKPSLYMELDGNFKSTKMIRYYNRPNSSFIYSFLNDSMVNISTAIYPTLQGIRYYLTQAVFKRCAVTDRPIACLLSGGLDSSLIAGLIVEYYRVTAINSGIPPPTLETYSIGLENSEDLKYARVVSEYLGTNHTEIILSEQDFIGAIPEVICAIESYDTTTVRASIGNYILGRYISANSQAKVIFNGDGSDELCGGYLYMENCPDCIEFDKETHRLLDEIYMYDVLRSDKCISSHGLEPRTPFLDKSWTQFYLAIPPNLRMPKSGECTKMLLRQSFSIYNCYDITRQILPDEILWRRKEAFSDGVSNKSRSLYEIIQNSHYISTIRATTPLEKEQMYYKMVFDTYYPNCNILSHYWVPKYTLDSGNHSENIDPSARTLKNYKNK